MKNEENENYEKLCTGVTRMEWNAWTAMSHKGMRHNPIRPQIIRQIPPAIPGTYGRMILSVV